MLLDEPRTVYLGGADFLNKATGYRLSQKLKGIQPSQDRALRFGPRRRYVLPDEPQWLTFINQRTSVADVGLRVLLLFRRQHQSVAIRYGGHTDIRGGR